MNTRQAVKVAVEIMENELNRMVVLDWSKTDETEKKYKRIADAIKALQTIPNSML